MDAIILAAGRSRRFGSDKLLTTINGKEMFRHILDILVNMQRRNRIDRLIFVTREGKVADIVRREYPLVTVVINQDPDRGISSSIRLGLLKLMARYDQIDIATSYEKKRTSEGCLFAVADQPYLRELSVGNLIDTWKLNRHLSLSDILGGNCGSDAGGGDAFGRESSGNGQCTRRFDNEEERGGQTDCLHIAACATPEAIGNPVIFDAKYYDELCRLHGDAGGKRVVMAHLRDTVLYPVLPMELRDIDKPEDAPAGG